MAAVASPAADIPFQSAGVDDARQPGDQRMGLADVGVSASLTGVTTVRLTTSTMQRWPDVSAYAVTKATIRIYSGWRVRYLHAARERQPAAEDKRPGQESKSLRLDHDHDPESTR
jgi:hypothetical protein